MLAQEPIRCTKGQHCRDSCDCWCGVSSTGWALAYGMLPSSADIRVEPNADIRVTQAGTTRHQIGVRDTSRFG